MCFRTSDLSEADLLLLLLYYIAELKLFAFSTKFSILSRLVFHGENTSSIFLFLKIKAVNTTLSQYLVLFSVFYL